MGACLVCGCAKQNTSRKKDGKGTVAPLAEDEIMAGMVILKWYRRFQARQEMRRRATWQVFQSLEYRTEKDHMSLYNFFNDLLLHSEGDNNQLLAALKANEKPAEENDLISATDPKTIEIESTYNGYHLTFPLDASQLPKLVEEFREKRTLHAKYILTILHETRKLLKGMGSWNHVPMGNMPFVTVCGDIHGQMEDLLLIFYKNGFPSRENPYVFNGDFVDRGSQSIEVAILLFSYFLVYPKSLFINRGNHEDQVMNLRYGFVKEAMNKYDKHSSKIIKLFSEVFSWLPICTVIDKKILVCHGGISNKTNLAEIDKLDRHQYISVLNPPQRDDLPDGHKDKIDFAAWRQILDMLWSDPKVQNGCEPNTFRGGGCYFGPDTLQMILRKHKFKMLIRSHECKPDGFEWMHDKLCLTVFSASNYYEEGSNRGAYIKVTKDVTRGDALPEIFPFQVTKATKVPSKRTTQNERAALASLKEKIMGVKTELMKQFKVFDPKETGVITVTQWCGVMSQVLALDLPWRSMRQRLIQADSNQSDMVLYESMFDEMTIVDKSGKDTDEDDLEKMYRHRNTLTQVFNAMDKDNSGFISRQEFIDACKILKRATKSDMTEKQIKAMAKNIDINKDGMIDINEFLEAYILISKSNSCAT